MTKFHSRFYDGPGLEHAGPNNRHVTSELLDCPVEVVTRAGQSVEVSPNKLTRLHHLREYAALIGEVATGALWEAPAQADWPSVFRLVSRHYIASIEERMSLSKPPADASYKCRINYRDQLSRIHHATPAGVSQVVAFLKVVPEVVQPKSSAYVAALRSKGFILHGAGLNDSIDNNLAYALASPKIDSRAANIFENLTYNPKWFTVLPNGAVGLDADKIVYLRDHRGKYPARQAKSDDVTYGCAAMKNISKLYDVTLGIAHRSELI